MLNHIYKVVWNRTRSCWQVVSELAKNNGRAKSARCRRGAKRLAAVALALGVMYMPGPAWAEEAAVLETQSDTGSLYHTGYGLAGQKEAQKYFENGTTIQSTAPFRSIVLDGSGQYLTLEHKGSGTKATMDFYAGSELSNLITSVNTNTSKNYDRIIAVYKVPDGLGGFNEKTVECYVKNGDPISYISLSEAVNDAYFRNPVVAAQIAAAAEANDTETLKQLLQKGMPQFYVTDGSNTEKVSLAVPNFYADWDTYIIDVPFFLGSERINSINAGAAAGYKYTYNNKISLAEGQVWRPLDRLITVGSAGGWNYDINIGWAMDEDGKVYTTDVTDFFGANSIHVSNSADETAAGRTFISARDVATSQGSMIDLSYLNTSGDNPPVNNMIYADAGNGAFPTGSYKFSLNGKEYSLPLPRELYINNASLADGTIFRLGSYAANVIGTSRDETRNIVFIGANSQDTVFINNAVTPDGTAKLYVQLGWVPGVGTAAQGEGKISGTYYPVVLGILNGAENFTVEGQTSLADGVFSVYKITPTIGRLDNYYNVSGAKENGGLIGEQGSAWYLESYTYEDTGSISESGKSVADNATVLNNLWRGNYLSMFRRVGSLHRQPFTEQRVAMLGDNASTAGRTAPASETATQEPGEDTSLTLGIASYPAKVEDQKENAWAEVWHGKYQSSSGYGRKVSQNYNGMQVGYDKLLNHEIHGGKVYNGFFLSKVEGDSTTASGGGKQDSEGLGIYASWVGKSGHYLDAALMASRLTNDYHLTGNTGDGTPGRVTGSYNTWAYGLGLQYGYQSPLDQNGWYWEPSAALFIGRTDGASYSLSNNLGISQDGANSVTGRLGIKAGKQLADGQGSLYAGVAALHEFSGGAGVNAFWGSQTRALETSGGKDTWWEWSLGGKWRISPTGVFNLDYNKTTGGSDGSDWRIHGGLSWTWGGFWNGKDSTAKTAAASGNIQIKEPVRGGTTLVVGNAPVVPGVTGEQPTTGSSDRQTETAPASAGSQQEVTAEVPAANPAPARPAAEQPVSAGDSGSRAEYTFAPVTVEAARPDWEKNLSPGQVSVIYPKAFEGEQKHLPDLLDRVPGLFVQRISGDGHYTVARVRGATGAQVQVYVDGVLMNLNGEAAVNLSTIPIDNVERVEVYRGYVPARFSGSPLGGVINIVTKKPQELGGHITQGMRSYGGYTGQYELSAPLGSGSIMATYQRDIWQGDFPFQYQASDPGYRGELYRRSNGYQNNNGMVKWQDDNWSVKAAWKDLYEELPRTVDQLDFGLNDRYWRGWFDAEQKIKQQEFQVAWRDTVGNLDWGWKTYYLDQKKNYRNIGALRAKDRGELPANYGNAYPGQLWTDFRSQKYGVNLNSALKMGGSHLLELNLDYSHESLDADGSHWTTWDDSMAGLNRQFLRHYTIREYHFTLQDSITLNAAGDFKLTPILRAEKVDMDAMTAEDRRWKYSGAAALQKQLDEHWSVKTSWGTYHRHPNFYELFGDGATIRPTKMANFWGIGKNGAWETGHQFDFGINWQGQLANADTDTAVTWFNRNAKNQLALWTPSVPNSTSTYVPMDQAEVHGVELTHSMKWNRLDLSLAGTWQKAEYTNLKDANIIGGRKSWISYTPEWVMSARLDYRFPGDKLSVYTEYNYTDKQFLGARDGSGENFAKPLTTVDLGLKYSFDKGWKLSAGVNDVFNKGYKAFQEYHFADVVRDQTLPYPLAGRTYYATMEYKF